MDIHYIQYCNAYDVTNNSHHVINSTTLLTQMSNAISNTSCSVPKLIGIINFELELVEHIPRVPWWIASATDGSILERSGQLSMRRIALFKHAQ